MSLRQAGVIASAILLVLVAVARPAAGAGVRPGGLLGSYAPSAGQPVSLTRVDPRIDFDWRRAAPARGFARRAFTVRWSGTIIAPHRGSWRLQLSARGTGVLLVTDGKRLVRATARSRPAAAGAMSASTAALTLRAGQRLPLALAFQAPARSGGSIVLRWARGRGRFRVVPSRALRPAAAAQAPPVSTAPSPVTTTPTSPTVTTPTVTTPTVTITTTTGTTTTPVTTTTTATTPTPTPTAHPPFGGNVNGDADYSPDFMFADAALSAGNFRALNGDGSIDYGADATTDSSGWPTEDFAVYINEQAPQPGTYTVKGTDTAEPTVTMPLTDGSIGQETWDPATGAFSLTVTVDEQNGAANGGGPGQFVLEFQNTDGGVRDLQVIRPGYDASSPPVFATPFLDELKADDPSVLRAMDLASTNANVVSTWSERTLPGQPQGQLQTATVPWNDGSTQTLTTPKGIAWEYIIDLANAEHTGLWVNVPVLADDDYVTHLAQLLKADLDPDLPVYVEYSNELWNYGFDQSYINGGLAQQSYDAGDTGLAYDPGTGEDDDDSVYTLANHRAAERTVQISELFSGVYGAADSRVHVVLANQYANPWLVTQQLDYIAAELGPPSRWISALAAAPYVAVPNNAGMSESGVLADLSSAIDTEQAAGTTQDWRTEAGAYGLGLDAYEGGFDTYGDQSIDAKKAAMLDPAITALVQRYLTDWYGDGGGLFNWYTLGTGSFDSQYGDWSITDDQTDLTQPKELGVQAIASGDPIAPAAGTELPAQIDARDHSFQHGIPVDPMVRYIGAGATFDYLVRAPSDGTYPLSVLTDAGPGEIDVAVDGVAAGSIEAAAPSSGDDVAESSSDALTLTAGLHVIRLTVPENRPFDLDSLLIRQDGGPALGPLLPRMNDFGFYQDQTLSAGGSFSNTFTVADSATPADQLKVTASSDNQAVVADSAITLTRQPGGEVDFTVTASPGGSGTADIVFTVTDAAGLQRQTEMSVTVN